MVSEYVSLKRSNCANCFRCLRDCPVQAVGFNDGQAEILDEDCILCGRCFLACPQHAKVIRDDLPVAKALVAGPGPVYVSLAPSFVARFPEAGIGGMTKALMALGFAGVEETAVGAAIVRNQYDAMLEAESQEVIISSCCHSVTMLLEKHYPQALPYLAPVLSPMQAHCRSLRDKNPQAKTVFIGPCISKKAEAEAYPGFVDCVLTFEDLARWLNEADIGVEPDSGPDRGGKTRLFPVTGGILRSMKRANSAYAYLAVDGIENCLQAVRDAVSGNLGKCFIEMSLCAGSCIGGPAMDLEHRQPVRGVLAVNAIAPDHDFPVDDPAPETLAKKFHPPVRKRYVVPETAIADILRRTGKTLPEHELNCGSCGYPTCRDKARAVVMGRADLTMCLPYLKEKAESFSDAIITLTPNAILVLDENLAVQQLNEAARMLFGSAAQTAVGQPVSRLMDPDIFLEARETGKTVQDRASCLVDRGRHVVMTVTHDPNFHIFVAVIRDVTDTENARRQREAMRSQTITAADEVVLKQMRVVQEIASLLGETAAETKIVLSRLKESLRGD